MPLRGLLQANTPPQAVPMLQMPPSGRSGFRHDIPQIRYPACALVPRYSGFFERQRGHFRQAVGARSGDKLQMRMAHFGFNSADLREYSACLYPRFELCRHRGASSENKTCRKKEKEKNLWINLVKAWFVSKAYLGCVRARTKSIGLSVAIPVYSKSICLFPAPVSL